MGHHVIAKFRCLSITQKYDGVFLAELKPVMQKGSNSKENAEFWSCSPNGDSQLCFYKKCPLDIGAYYYINMVHEDDAEGADDWKLSYLTRNESGGAEVYLCWYKSYDYRDGKPEGMLQGSVKIYMDPKAKGAIEAFRDPGTKWKVTFDFAEPSDNES